MIGGGTTSFSGIEVRPHFLRQKIMLSIFLFASGALGLSFMFMFTQKEWDDGWGFFLCGVIVLYNFGKYIREFLELLHKEKEWTESDKRTLRFIISEIEEEQCRVGKR